MPRPPRLALSLLTMAALLAAAPATTTHAVIAAAVQDSNAQMDVLILEAIKAGQMPGAVVLVGRGDVILFQKAYGQRAVVPTPEAMTADTIFDLASLTK